MARTVEIPVTLLKAMARATEAFSRLEDELEDYLLGQDPEFVARMREARASHVTGDLVSIGELKAEYCTE
jgi:hypothetical protein